MATQTSLQNVVLSSIPTRELKRLRANLEPVNLAFGEILYQPGERIRHVYFPTDCLISLLTVVDKRRSLEVGMVGNEGMAGMPFILGVGVSGVRALVQGAGAALRMEAAAFRAEFDHNRGLQQALYRYTYALMAQISQTAACNRFHGAEERLARWLLMTRDRVHSDRFALTHGGRHIKAIVETRIGARRKDRRGAQIVNRLGAPFGQYLGRFRGGRLDCCRQGVVHVWGSPLSQRCRFT